MTTTTMRAAIFSGPKHIRIDQVPMPVPGPGQVRVRLQGCGVCASNLPVWQGRPWFEYPFAPGAPGHEGWGVVDALGEGVEDIEPGARVALLSYNAYAEYDVAAAAALVQLPTELDDAPFPGEPLACAMNIFRRSAIRAGQTVAVVGCGFLGILLVALAARAGARVLALSRRPYALTLAQRFGAAETVAVADPEAAMQQVQALTAGRGCERVLEVVGAQATLDMAAELVAERGMLIIAGYHQDGLRQINLQSWNWRGIDVINAHERDPAVYRAGLEAALTTFGSQGIDPAPLYTHRLGLAELPHAFATMAARPPGYLKALLQL